LNESWGSNKLVEVFKVVREVNGNVGWDESEDLDEKEEEESDGLDEKDEDGLDVDVDVDVDIEVEFEVRKSEDALEKPPKVGG
jgi:hypothetical protein